MGAGWFWYRISFKFPITRNLRNFGYISFLHGLSWPRKKEHKTCWFLRTTTRKINPYIQGGLRLIFSLLIQTLEFFFSTDINPWSSWLSFSVYLHSLHEWNDAQHQVPVLVRSVISAAKCRQHTAFTARQATAAQSTGNCAKWKCNGDVYIRSLCECIRVWIWDFPSTLFILRLKNKPSTYFRFESISGLILVGSGLMFVGQVTAVTAVSGVTLCICSCQSSFIYLIEIDYIRAWLDTFILTSLANTPGYSMNRILCFQRKRVSFVSFWIRPFHGSV